MKESSEVQESGCKVRQETEENDDEQNRRDNSMNEQGYQYDP